MNESCLAMPFTRSMGHISPVDLETPLESLPKLPEATFRLTGLGCPRVLCSKAGFFQ